MTVSDTSSIATQSFPSAIGWEESFVRHYLRADGPWGPSPLRHLDVTPEQLALAIGRSTGDGDAVLKAFLKTIVAERNTVRNVFVHGVTPASPNPRVPGFFRYLVFSSVIAACSEELSIERDYRERMRKVMGDNFRFGHMPGLPMAWQALARWAGAARSQGQPIRSIELPSRGSMKQIGYSCFIAFPYRRDRDRLRKLVEENGEYAFRSPSSALTIFDLATQTNTWSPGFSATLDDFRSRVQRSEVLLLSHPIWELARSTIDDARKVYQKEEKQNGVLRLLVGFDDSDLAMEFDGPAPFDGHIEERLADGRAGYSVFGPVSVVMKIMERLVRTEHPAVSDIAPNLELGFLAFESTDVLGRWIHRRDFDERPYQILVLCRRPFPSHFQDAKRWVSVGDGWFISRPLPSEAYDEVRTLLGLERQEVSSRPGRVHIVDGIRVGKRLLGRPCSMPSIVTPVPARVDIKPVARCIGAVTLEAAPEPMRWRLTTTNPASGLWSISAWESDDDEGKRAIATTAISLTRDASEHVDLKTATSASSNLIIISETEKSGYGDLVDVSGAPIEDEKVDGRILDLLEAIYAGGRSGWSEKDLVGRIRRCFDASVGEAFDHIRSLQEAAVLDVLTFARWRSRRWFLRSPRLVTVVSGTNPLVVFDGTPCARLVERFSNTVHALGGIVCVRNGISYSSPPTFVAGHCDTNELAARLGWSLERARFPGITAAPKCWALDKRTSHGFDVKRTWSWDHGRFFDANVRSEIGVELRCWERSDHLQRDIFELEMEDRNWTFSSRVAAILEAHRLASKALFTLKGNELARTSADGYLPLEVARTIRLATLRSSGPLGPPSRENSYGYFVAPHVYSWVRSLLGPAIGGITGADADNAFILALSRSGRVHEPMVWHERLDHPRYVRLQQILMARKR